MNTDPCRCAIAPVIAVLGASMLYSGQTNAQIDTREWLFPQSGFWSDPANWSDSDAPDSLSEAARLSPTPELVGGGTLGEALIEQFIEVDSVLANGLIDIRVASGAELSVRNDIRGDAGGQARVILGDVSTSGGTAELRFDSRRSGLVGATVEMIDPGGGSVIEANSSSISSDSIVRGIGEIRDGDTLINEGLIESVQVSDDSNVLRIGETEMINRGRLYAGFGSQLLVENSWINSTEGGEFTAEGELVLRDSELVGGSLEREGRGSVTVQGETVFERVEIHPVVIDVEGDLIINNGEFNNDGFVYPADNGTITLEGDTVFSGSGFVDFARPDARVRITGNEQAVLTNDTEHTISGRGDILAGLTNRGALEIRAQGSTGNTLLVRGPFVQESEGTLDLIAQEIDGRFGVDRLIVDRHSAALGGTLCFRLIGFVGDTVGQPHAVIRVLQNDPAQQITGTFESVVVKRTSSASDISPFIDIDYLPDRVDVTWFCKADVNRNGAVEPTDFNAWIDAFNRGDPLADSNENGVLSGADFNAWLFLYERPCGR